MHTLNKAVLHLQHENHQYQGFVHFSVSQGVPWSTVELKNQVLPLLASHSCQRSYNEVFLIYDKTYDQAPVYQNGQHEILPLLVSESSEPGKTELRHRKSWHTLCGSISIRGREDLRLCMARMQERYWKHLIEIQYNLFWAEQAESGQSAETQSGARRPDALPSDFNSILP